jgi:hypothetical protein
MIWIVRLLIGEAVDFVAETFNVTRSFALKRLKQMEQRLLASQLNNQFAAAIEAESQYIREIGCGYVVKGRQGSTLYNLHRGLIGVIKYKETY